MMILFSSVQESLSQISSTIFSGGSCCVSTLVDQLDDSCDTEGSTESDSCCEGSSCDCTCCVHISLFNTSFGQLSFLGESEKDIYDYVDTHGATVPFSIFHPPLILG